MKFMLLQVFCVLTSRHMHTLLCFSHFSIEDFNKLSNVVFELLHYQHLGPNKFE